MPRSAARVTSETYTVDPEVVPDVSDIVIEDGKPVDNIYSERQMRLLVASLYDSWQGPGDGRPFLALANVGVFMTAKQPPVVPDVLVSLDVEQGDVKKKENLSYFVWIRGKAPDLVVEVVSSKEGGELTGKMEKYAGMGIPYYVVWDLEKMLGRQQLTCFVLSGGRYQPCEPWFPLVQLGVATWQGTYQGLKKTWLRWRDADGNLLLTGAEQAEKQKEHLRRSQEKARKEKRRAEEQKRRADALAAKLRALGVDPDQP